MSFIEIVNEDTATGTVKDDYAFIAGSYSHAAQVDVPAPQVYRSSSLVPAYFRFGAVQNRVLTNDGRHDKTQPQVPNILVNFALSFYSSCFY